MYKLLNSYHISVIIGYIQVLIFTSLLVLLFHFPYLFSYSSACLSLSTPFSLFLPFLLPHSFSLSRYFFPPDFRGVAILVGVTVLSFCPPKSPPLSLSPAHTTLHLLPALRTPVLGLARLLQFPALLRPHPSLFPHSIPCPLCSTDAAQ